MRTILSALIVVMLGAAACGGSAEVSVAASAEDGPESFEDIEYRSPIGEFLGQDFSQSDDREAEFAEMEREAGRRTAECMREKGFEYTPMDTSSMVSFGGPGGELPYFSDEWVAKYGFGITTQRFPQSMVGDLVGFPDEQFGGPDEAFVDPNSEYMESLSEGEREAYQEALWGQPPDFGPEGPPEDFEFEPSGCQNEAFDEVFNEGFGDMDAFYQAFGDDLEAMQERVQADPRVVAFNAEVGTCVSAAGMTWVDMEDLYSRFESQLESVQPDVFRGGDPFEEAGLDPEEMSEREMDDFFRELNRLDPESLAKLGALQAEEIELAQVVVGCGGGPLQEQVLLSDVRIEYEQEFLDNNAAALEEFKPAG